MSTLEQIRRHLGSTWDALAEGWQHLRERTEQALTRFLPPPGRRDVETWEDQLMRRTPDWGLLATEIQEDSGRLVVRLEVPGMERQDFDIDVIDNHLVVRGQKRFSEEHRSGRYHVLECAYGSFERAIPLPVEVDPGKADARYRRGVLTVTLHKHERARGRRIPVNG